ncbi:MAG: hypothetical protein HRU19_21925 [Pseudobacteriovorax sp.]|nr:hypothetical protein [Pseudobacteriovorax sp.]
MLKLGKHLLLHGSLIAGLLAAGAQSCSDEEIAVGAAVIAVGAAISAGHNGGHHHGQKYCSYNERVCRTYTDYWGDRRKECKIVKRRRPCGSHGHYRSFQPELSNEVSALETLVELKDVPVTDYLDVVDLSKRYYLSLGAAETFIDAMETARQGDLSAINELGLNDDDMQRMTRLLVPEDDSIDRLAQNLDQDPLLTKGMLSQIVVHGRNMKREACKAEEDNRFSNKRIRDHFCINQ